MLNLDREQTAVPAWALLFRSPFEPSEGETSWLAGKPTVPTGFEWSNDTDGFPLSFLAQIDLASIEPEPITGLRPPHLPEKGALLVFIGKRCSCHVLTEIEVARSIFRSAPRAAPCCSTC